MAPRLSGRIAACTLALLVAGAVHGPAAYALPSEVGIQPGAAAGEGMGADRTVARSYRVIAPAYEVNSRGVGYAVWVSSTGTSTPFTAPTSPRPAAGPRGAGSRTRSRGVASRGTLANQTWPWTIAAGPLSCGRRRSAAR